MNNVLILVAASLALGGCAARSKMVPVSGGQILAGHANPVCILRAPLPAGVGYTLVATVKSNKRSYGSVTELFPLMATEARQVGADAVINVEAGHKAGFVPWGFSRPSGTGTAVKISDPSTFNCVASGGELK